MELLSSNLNCKKKLQEVMYEHPSRGLQNDIPRSSLFSATWNKRYLSRRSFFELDDSGNSPDCYACPRAAANWRSCFVDKAVRYLARCILRSCGIAFSVRLTNIRMQAGSFFVELTFVFVFLVDWPFSLVWSQGHIKTGADGHGRTYFGFLTANLLGL